MTHFCTSSSRGQCSKAAAWVAYTLAYICGVPFQKLGLQLGWLFHKKCGYVSSTLGPWSRRQKALALHGPPGFEAVHHKLMDRPPEGIALCLRTFSFWYEPFWSGSSTNHPECESADALGKQQRTQLASSTIPKMGRFMQGPKMGRFMKGPTLQYEP